MKNGPGTEEVDNSPPNSADDSNVGLNSEAKQTFTVEDAIEKIGFGKFQIKVLAMIGFAWSADSLEMALLAILAPAIRCYWDLTHWHEAFLTTIVFIGMFLATYIWGYSSDNYGRRMVLIISIAGVFTFGLASAFSFDYTMLITLRGFVGACMGGVVQGTTLIVEYLPVSSRGLTVNLGSIFWSFGTSVEILTAMFIMPRFGWRVLLFVSAWPCLLFVIISLIIKYPPESVRFLVSNNEKDEAMEILQQAAKDNNKVLPEGEITDESQHKACNRGSLLEMFRSGYWKVTILLWIIWFASHFNIYGLALLATALFSNSKYTCYGSTPNLKVEDTCKMLTQQDYEHFFYVLAADFPAIALAALMADTVGRKWLQAIGFFAMGIFFSLLLICTNSRPLTTFFLFGVRCFAAVADIGGYIYTPEVYPTHIRGIALGSCSGISRLGCMLTPFVSQVLSHYSLTLSLGTYVTVSLLGGICSLLLPIETKGKGLEEINRDLQNLNNKTNYEPIVNEPIICKNAIEINIDKKSQENTKSSECELHDGTHITLHGGTQNTACPDGTLQSSQDFSKYPECIDDKTNALDRTAGPGSIDITSGIRGKLKDVGIIEKHYEKDSYDKDVLELNSWLETPDEQNCQIEINPVEKNLQKEHP